MSKETLGNLLHEASRSEKAAELSLLPSSIDKIKFWYKLGLNWLDQSEADRINDIPLASFKFSVPKQEYKEVNEWILKNYLRLSNHPKKEKRLLNLDELIVDFERRLEVEATDKQDYISEEQMKIDKSFEAAVTVSGTGIFKPTFSAPLGYSTEYFANAESFYNFQRYGKLPKYSEITPYVGSVLMAENGVTMAKFRNYLSETASEKQEEQEDSEKATRAQKMLLLHYSGVLGLLQKEIPVQAKLTRFLQLLINAHPDNIKKDIAALYRPNSKLRTSENFEFVANQLDIAGMDKNAAEVREVLARIYKAEEKR